MTRFFVTKFSVSSHLIFVLCGSVSAWIVENILNSTGFVGRNSLDIELKELSISDSVQMWGSCAERMSTREKLDMFSVTGGVPKCLEEVRPSLSVEENLSVRTALVYDGRLSPRVEADCFFDFVIPADQLFGVNR